MHAVVVRATIHNADRTREVLNSQAVPQASGAPGFKAGTGLGRPAKGS